jgi:hypothetical protein
LLVADAANPRHDWAGSARSSILAWWAPRAAMLAALLVPVPARAGIWTVALVWMGTACLLNARRCNRTHCRFTGPYYLAMTAPVLVFGLDLVSVGTQAWIVLGAIIVAGSRLIWWASERAWGKFS